MIGMSDNKFFSVDRSAFSEASLYDKTDEIAYWHSKTPEERMQALELMRQVVYGYDESSIRFQRFFEVVELSRS